jgi:cyclic beta-1,2-glucan synthetase
MLAGALALLFLPALDLAIAFVQRVVAWQVGPRRLPRLDLTDGVPDGERTMVIVPTILGSVDGVARLLEHLEVLAHGNLDPRIHFAILSDVVDAPTAVLDDDAAIVAAACEGILNLNLRFGPDHTDRFFLFHRERRWNARERVWMGWERKRGKIDEFNRLLRGDDGTTFTTRVGDLDVLPDVRYCLTLDTDTFLPRDAAKSLIGIIAHPLNRPRFDAVVGRVTEGYAILQPRVSVTMASAAGSVFARLYAGHTGSIPTRRRSPTRIRICSTKASSPARACTTSTPSSPRSAIACRTTRCCRTTCSRGFTPGRRSPPISNSSTTTHRR